MQKPIPEVYVLTPRMIRDDQRLILLDPETRGIFRDLLDLMWISATKCSLPAKYDVLAERINTTDRKLKKAVKTLCSKDVSLLRLDKSPMGEFIYSEFLEKQKDGDLSDLPQAVVETITSKKDDLIGSLEKYSRKRGDTHVQRIFISAEEAFGHSSFSDWLPTNRFGSNGEAYVVSEALIKNLHSRAKTVDVELALSQVFNWLMKPENDQRRPTYAGMPQFLDKWMQRSARSIAMGEMVKTRKSSTEALSNEEFEAELEALLGDF